MDMTVKEIMSSDVKTINDYNTISEAAEMMLKHDIGFLPVLKSGIPIGVITDRDIILREIATNKEYSTKIEDVMTNNIVYANTDETITEISEKMAYNQLRRIPVIENDKLIGVVTLSDLSRSSKSDDKAKDALKEISKEYFKDTLGFMFDRKEFDNVEVDDYRL